MLPTINRQVFSSIASEHLCNAICKRDPGCYATVWNSTTKRCYTKAEDGMDRIKSRSDYILSSCSDPRPDPPGIYLVASSLAVHSSCACLPLHAASTSRTANKPVA